MASFANLLKPGGRRSDPRVRDLPRQRGLGNRQGQARATDETAFPNTPDFIGHNAPSRIECDIYDLVVEGKIPAGHQRHLVPLDSRPAVRRRCSGDDTYPERRRHGQRCSASRAATWISACATCRPSAGRTSARRAARSTACIATRTRTIRASRGKGKPRRRQHHADLSTRAAARAEGRQPRAGRWTRSTLETRRRMGLRRPAAQPDDDGASAPRSRTGELYFFGYEAGGLATRDVAYCVADKNGELVAKSGSRCRTAR